MAKMASGISKGAMTKIYTYARTMQSNSEYAQNMRQLSAQIFGEKQRKFTKSTRKMTIELQSFEPKEQSERLVIFLVNILSISYSVLEETSRNCICLLNWKYPNPNAFLV